MVGYATCIEACPSFRIRRRAITGAIDKGTVLKLSDANVAAASAADNDVFGGIALEEVYCRRLYSRSHIGVAKGGKSSMASIQV